MWLTEQRLEPRTGWLRVTTVFPASKTPFLASKVGRKVTWNPDSQEVGLFFFPTACLTDSIMLAWEATRHGFCSSGHTLNVTCSQHLRFVQWGDKTSSSSTVRAPVHPGTNRGEWVRYDVQRANVSPTVERNREEDHQKDRYVVKEAHNCLWFGLGNRIG